MVKRSNDRDIKVALTSLKLVLDSIQNGNIELENNEAGKESHEDIKMMLRKMRVSKLS